MCYSHISIIFHVHILNERLFELLGEVDGFQSKLAQPLAPFSANIETSSTKREQKCDDISIIYTYLYIHVTYLNIFIYIYISLFSNLFPNFFKFCS